MIFTRRPLPRILIWRQPVDMRKSFDGLVGVVRSHLGEDPLSGSLFVFVNRRGNYLKLVYWDRTGFLSPSVALARGAGRGRGRIYSFRDVVALKTAQALREQGISLNQIRSVVAFLQGRGVASPLTEAV